MSYEINAEVHLEPGETLVAARLQALSVNLGVLRFRGVGIAPNAVPERTAKHLVDRNAIRLARKVPQCHFHRANAACLPGGTAELLNLAEDLIHVARIFSENTALQLQR